MIVKLQSPLNDPTAMWLVYGPGKKFLRLMHRGTIPENVREAVTKAHGIAYFEIEPNGLTVTFGEQVGEQTW